MTTQVTQWNTQLNRLGMLHPVAAGIQIDINAAVRRQGEQLLDGSLCDHNCTMEGGNYICPAAVSLNRGFMRSSFAPATDILRGIDTVVKGLRATHDQFLGAAFDQYCQAFQVPPDVASAFGETMSSAPIEVNLFGGNPEMHPEVMQIIAALRQRRDIVINFTTTGRRMMRDATFAAQVLECPPDLLALSADDFESADQIRYLRGLSRDALYQEWKKIPWTHGQRQKAIEAIYAAMLVADVGRPQILFNLVIHAGNVGQIESIVAALAESFPGCRVNPFPAQSAFMYEPGNIEDLTRLEQVIDWMIETHKQESAPVTRRLHYWLALKAACEVYRSNPRRLTDVLSGNEFWQCYKSFGANRYVQVGKAAGVHQKSVGGGHLGCFWNDQTITRDDTQVWNMDVQDITSYLSSQAQQLAAQSTNPCPGCAFPRLLFDAVSTELGLHDALVPTYLDLRHKHAGY